MFCTFDKLVLLLAVSIIFGEYLADAECPADRKKPWSYDRNLPNGPDHWGDKYPLCNGRSQTPISIETRYTQKENTTPLHIVGYDKPVTKFNIRNTGYRVVISPMDGVSRVVQIKGHTYSLKSFHFHWGNVSYEGAEHIINGKTGAIALHLLHKDRSGNPVVLAVIHDISALENKGFSPIVNYLPTVKYAGDKTKVNVGQNMDKQIHLADLLPDNSPYYIYYGSLSTPPCSENVTWVVYEYHSHLNEEQIDQFRHLSSTTEKNAGSGGGNCHLVNNFRPIQKRNNRKVLYFYD